MKGFKLTHQQLLAIMASLTIILMLGMYALFVNAHQKAEVLAEKTAVNEAENYVNEVIAFRNFYTKLVVPRVTALDGHFSHDYINQPNTFPLPATFAKDFTDFLSNNNGAELRLYSDMPFPWRGSNAGARDNFEISALKAARENPDQPYWKIEEKDGVKTLRYTKADILQESCVGCHNTYPGTPKTDWKVGDVRGVYELSRPINKQLSFLEQSINTIAFYLLLLGGGVILLLFGLIHHFRKVIHIAELHAQEAETTNHRLNTEIKEKEELTRTIINEEKKLQAIFGSVNDAIILIDSHGIVQDMNGAVTRLMGYHRNELLGQNINIIIPEPHASAHDAYIQRYLNTGQAHILGYGRQLKAKHKDHRLIDIELAVSEMLIGEDRYFVGVIRDIALRLETERTLKVARDKAIENAKLKTQFLTNISHELRTPLNGIIGMSHLLVQELERTEQNEQIRIIHNSAQQLLSIIDDILDLSNIEASKFTLNPKPFNVQSWLYDTLAIHIAAAHQKSLAIEAIIDAGVPEEMTGDAMRLAQIINKLVSNAIKFTAEGKVIVRLHAIAQENNEYKFYIHVKDTGIGISTPAISKLFEAFSQVDGSTTRMQGGTGLGLTISRQLAIMMRGDISVHSEPGHGSEFIVTVLLTANGDTQLAGNQRTLTSQPVSNMTQPAPTNHNALNTLKTDIPTSDSTQTMTSTTPMQLLLVEDNLVNQKVALALIKRLGHTVDVANNGAECLQKIANTRYDAIIMDCQMPVMDGYQASEAIRRQEADTGQHIPIIALTAHAMKGDAEKCYASGMDDYLTKPINHALLKERLDYWRNWLVEQNKNSKNT